MNQIAKFIRLISGLEGGRMFLSQNPAKWSLHHFWRCLLCGLVRPHHTVHLNTFFIDNQKRLWSTRLYRSPYHHSSWVLATTENSSATISKFWGMMSILRIRKRLNSENFLIWPDENLVAGDGDLFKKQTKNLPLSRFCFVGPEINCRRCILSVFSPLQLPSCFFVHSVASASWRWW